MVARALTSALVFGFVLFGCAAVGEGLDYPEGYRDADGSPLIPDEDWSDEEEELEPTTTCAKGVRPTEALEVDPATDAAAGTLRVQKDGKWLGMPLERVSYQTRVVGTVAETKVEQVFGNPFDTPIEAVYVFPLPEAAAVDGYEFRVGKRTIKGVIKRRDEARKMYEDALQSGQRAALLEQERPNIFTQSVANIRPGESITVAMHVVGPVDAHMDRFELALPTVVGPRFIPGSPVGKSGGGFAQDTNRVPDASKLTPKPLPEGYVSCAALDIRVTLDAGVAVGGVASRTHAIDVGTKDSRATVELSHAGELLNRDFVLRWKTGGKESTSSMMVQKSAKGGGYFTLVVFPPTPEAAEPVDRELIFVVDTSGSMSGTPIGMAKAAMHKLVDGMRPGDAFQVVRFDNDASSLGPALLSAAPNNRKRAHRAIAGLNGRGGTHMLAGIDAALDLPHDADRLKFVLFMTDGYIGNETEIFRAVHRGLGEARIFSMGIGSSVNRYLLDGLARAGRGAVTYVDLQDRPGRAVREFYDRLDKPVLTDIEIDWSSLGITDVVPSAIPDVFVGQPVVVYGRFKGNPKGTVRVLGRAGSNDITIPVPVDVTRARPGTGLSSMWARTRIAELSDAPMRGETDTAEIDEAITKLGLAYRLVTKFTSFVAIDGDVVTNGDPARVDVPVEVPDGVSRSTSYPPGAGADAGPVGFAEAADEPMMVAPKPAPAPQMDSAPAKSRRARPRREDRGVTRYKRSKPSPRRSNSGSVTARSPRSATTPSATRYAGLRQCFKDIDDHLDSNRVTFEVRVTASGEIKSVRLLGSGYGSARLHRCLRREIKGWEFKAGKAATFELVVDYRS